MLAADAIDDEALAGPVEEAMSGIELVFATETVEDKVGVPVVTVLEGAVIGSPMAE